MEAPEYADRMREVQLRGSEWEEFIAKTQPWLDDRRGEEIVELFQAARVPAAPIGDGEKLPGFEHFVARGLFVPQPEAGFPRPRGPFRLSATPLAEPRPAPRLGEDGAAVRAEWSEPGTGTAPVAGARRPSPATRSWGGGRPGLPFSGLKILDLTSFWAGPYPTMYLACLGADVLKVEAVKRPDGFRFIATGPEFGERWWEQGVLYLATNLGKRSLTLDLDQAAGLDLARRLIAEADVLAENYAPRVMEAFGLDHDSVREINPGLVMLRMPGFGLSGPWRDNVGWAQTFEQMAGCATVTGDADGPPMGSGGFADPVVGMHTAVALQAALTHRDRSGEGQLIEVPQSELLTCMTAEQTLHHALTGERLTRTGNRSREMAPQGVYPCAGEDQWVAVTVRDDADWQRLVRALGAPAWSAAPELARLEGRVAAHDELDRQLAAWTAPQEAPILAERLRSAGVPAAALLRNEELYGEPQLEARGYFQAIDHPVLGTLRYPGWPMHFSFGPTPIFAGPAPTLGQHNHEILSGVLGLAPDEIEALRGAGVIGETLKT
jgi:crotonobetainyl-CoA:carnitine CoA-transferase CaiB-like acyl-CoA transferase